MKIHNECVFTAWCKANENWPKAVRCIYCSKDWLKTNYVRKSMRLIQQVAQFQFLCVFFFYQTYVLMWMFNFFFFVNSSQLPARSTRLLNRSRLQHTNLNGTESPRSIENLNLIHKTASQFGRDSANGSPDEQLFMLDKTLRNSMIQDVQYCKQQLLQLRSLLQEVSVWIFFFLRI